MTVQPPSAADLHAASAARQRHLFFAALAIVVVGLAFALNVHHDRVALAGLSDYPLPHLCMSRSMFGVTCPGCGLTRSFVHLAHGDWQASWRAHRLGWLMAAVVLFQLPYRTWMLAGRRDALPARVVQVFAAIVVALLIINWAIGLVERNSFRSSNVERNSFRSSNVERNSFRFPPVERNEFRSTETE